MSINIYKIIPLGFYFLFFAYSLRVNSQIHFSPDLTMKEELKYRANKPYKEEKYYKNGRLDSIYRRWNVRGQKLTEGYYVNGKRHGEWTEWLTKFEGYNYIKFTYSNGILRKIYSFQGRDSLITSPKYSEDYYTLEPNKRNYTKHSILWNTKLGKGKKAKVG